MATTALKSASIVFATNRFAFVVSLFRLLATLSVAAAKIRLPSAFGISLDNASAIGNS
jgi:hypothetical protein